MGVGDRVDDGHRPGQGELQPPLCVGAGDTGLDRVDAPAPPQRSGDRRHQRFVAVVADAHRHPPAEIDPIDMFEEAVDKVLPRLLAIGHDVDPGILLLL